MTDHNTLIAKNIVKFSFRSSVKRDRDGMRASLHRGGEEEEVLRELAHREGQQRLEDEMIFGLAQDMHPRWVPLWEDEDTYNGRMVRQRPNDPDSEDEDVPRLTDDEQTVFGSDYESESDDETLSDRAARLQR